MPLMPKSFLSVLTTKVNALTYHELIGQCLLLYIILKSHILDLVMVFPIILVVLFFVLTVKSYLSQSVFWLLVLLLFIPSLFTSYFHVANHFFITIYLILILAISSYFSSDRNRILRLNAKYVLAILMILAVIQKLLSEEFMSGETIGYMGYTGQLFKFPVWFFPEIKEAISFNNSQLYQETQYFPQTLKLEAPFPYFQKFSLFFSYLTIIAEVVFAGLLFSKSKLIKNCFFAFFVLLLIFTRQETGFIALLTILLLMQLGPKRSIFKMVYLGLFILSLGLTIVRWGFV